MDSNWLEGVSLNKCRHSIKVTPISVIYVKDTQKCYTVTNKVIY